MVVIFLLSCNLWVNILAREQSPIDSLRKLIVPAKSDSSLMKTYLEIGDYYQYSTSDSALYYYRKAYKLAEKLKAGKYIAQSLKEIGRTWYFQNEYDSAVPYFDKALVISRKIGDKKSIAKLLMNYGNIYIKRSIYDKALEYELAALKLYEKIDDSEGYSSCLNNIGIIYYYQKNYPKTLEYYQKSLQIKTEAGDREGMAILLGNIGNLYNDIGETDKSLKYNTKSLKIYQELNDKKGIARIFNNIGEVYVKKKNYPLSLEYFNKALKLLEEAGYKRGISLTLLNIAGVFNITGQYNKALKNEFRALKLAMEIGELNSQQIAYERIVESYKGLGTYKKALQYKEKWFRIHDSIFNTEKAGTVALLEARLQSERQQQQIQLQQSELEKNKAELARVEAEKKRQELERDLFFIVSGLLLVLVVSIFYFYRRKKMDNKRLIEQKKKIDAINKELKDKNEELLATLESLKRAQQQLVQSEKMASLGMLSAGIAHEINNPINFVYAGINSLLHDFRDIEPVIKEINEINPESDKLKERLKKIQQLKIENYFDEAFEAIPQIIADIKLGAERTAEIVNSLRSFSRLDSGEKQTYDIHEGLDSSVLLLGNKYKNRIEIVRNYASGLPDIVCHPGKINQALLNLLSNAIDSIEGEGKIWITTSWKKDIIKVSIRDTGSGMGEETKQKIFDPFFTTKTVGKGTGLGMSITYGIIREHGGEIEIFSEPGKGTEIVITLPVE